MATTAEERIQLAIGRLVFANAILESRLAEIELELKGIAARVASHASLSTSSSNGSGAVNESPQGVPDEVQAPAIPDLGG